LEKKIKESKPIIIPPIEVTEKYIPDPLPPKILPKPKQPELEPVPEVELLKPPISQYESIIKPIQDLLPCVQFCASTPIQHALMCALQIAEKPYDGYANYYEWMRQQFQSKRMILQEGLEAAGIEALESEGGFFLMGKLPIRPDILKAAQNSNEPYDWHFCRMLAKEYGIVAIPASPFFSSKEAANTMGPMARFAFCKLDKTLLEAKKSLIAGALKYSRKLEMDSMINVEK
jgi:aspartate/methionine/tyrosine aminotransferase